MAMQQYGSYFHHTRKKHALINHNHDMKSRNYEIIRHQRKPSFGIELVQSGFTKDAQ